MIDDLRRSVAHVFIESLETPSLTSDDEHHLLKVLRVSESDRITVCDGAGGWMSAQLGRSGDLRAISEVAHVERPRWKLCIAFAPVKGDKPEIIVQKLTELGIDEIVPLAPTAHSVVRWDEQKAAKHVLRLQRVAVEAAMQSRRVWLPKVQSVTPIDEFVAMDGVAFAEPGGNEITDAHRTIVIGPEGGFSPEEIARAGARVTLGESVLRAETAAIVAGALMSRCRRTNTAMGNL